MTNAVYKKLVTKRRAKTKMHLARLSEAPRSSDGMFSPQFDMETFQEFYASDRNQRAISLFLTGWFSDWQLRETHYASKFQSEDAEALYVHFSHHMSKEYLARQLKLELAPQSAIFNSNHVPLTMGLYSIGWHQEADQIVRQIWDYPSAPRGTGFHPDNLVTWFVSYFSLGSRDLIARAGPNPHPNSGSAYGEPNEPDSPYSYLLGCWKDPDPAKVRNSLVAYSEQNMARSMLPPNKRLGFDFHSWWYVPWDILAINMRRKALGLEWVETGDPRMEEVWQNREELPMVKDDLVWPAYLEICDILGVEPYKPRKSIEVKVNRTTFDLEVIG